MQSNFYREFIIFKKFKVEKAIREAIRYCLFFTMKNNQNIKKERIFR